MNTPNIDLVENASIKKLFGIQILIMADLPQLKVRSDSIKDLTG